VRPNTLIFPPNPAYGDGRCRRLIRIDVADGAVSAHLSDNFHELRCRVQHDGHTVLAIEGTPIRLPTTACPGAIAVLQDLVGTSLTASGKAFYGGGKAQHHCTHLYDLAVLAIRHARRGIGTTCYDAQVPDETDAPVALSITCNGVAVHRWTVRQGVILDPPDLAGRTLEKGFAAWAVQTFVDDELEAATILARTWLIAVGRGFLIDAAAGEHIDANVDMIGRCFAYQPERATEARFVAGQLREPESLTTSGN
jgi:hypothetical protein